LSYFNHFDESDGEYELNTGCTYKTKFAADKFPDDGNFVPKHLGFGT
jgi:hypothetical protein